MILDLLDLRALLIFLYFPLTICRHFLSQPPNLAGQHFGK